MIQTKLAGVQGQRHRYVRPLRRQGRVSVTLSSHIGAINSTTLVDPTRRDRSTVDTFCGNEGAEDPAVSDKRRRKRLQQTRSIMETYHEVVL